MIKVRLNRQSYQYDVHSLVRAFYPQHDVKVDLCLETAFGTLPAADEDRGDMASEPTKPVFSLDVFLCRSVARLIPQRGYFPGKSTFQSK